MIATIRTLWASVLAALVTLFWTPTRLLRAAGEAPRLLETPTQRLLRLGLSISGGADTTVAGGAAIAVQAWSDDIWLELPEAVFMAPYLQKEVNAIIQVKEELDGKPGEKITFTLARQLTGAGVTGDTTLEGSEEAMTFHSDDVTLNQYRNGVRLAGRLSERRTAFEQRKVAKQLLKDWLADQIDDKIFTALSTSPSSGRVAYGGDAVSTATIESGDYLDLALISRVKVIARKATPQIFPVRIEGGDYFLLVVSPDSLHDLKLKDPAWSQAQREAQERGKMNPLFTGAEGIWDGVVIRSSTRTALATTWGAGSNLAGSENLFLGRQAGVFAWGERPQWVEQSFDYANKIGFAISAIYDVTKAVFNSVDNGVITVRTFRSNIS
jgi:N4-gp56 family major capsid protein